MIREGSAYLPDSVHRHLSIDKAVESVASGSSFDPSRRFSLRIWSVPEAFEDTIFYAMNMEHDKADATRSKWLAQKNRGQKLAAIVVRTSPHMGESNIETVTNSLSSRNPRLAAFNTISNGFEASWADIDEADEPNVVTWFVGYWDKLVSVLPELGKLPLPERRKCRENSLVGSAIVGAGLRPSRGYFYDNELELNVLDKFTEKHVEEDGTSFDLFAWDNPEWQRRGVVVPAVKKSGEQTLTVRTSHQTRRAMEAALIETLGIAT